MKARPRSVEREVAECLTTHFTSMGLSAVQRIPILGREGPDLTVNGSKLAIDVKSRKCIPVCFHPYGDEIAEDLQGHLAVKLKNFPLLYSDVGRSNSLLSPSIQVTRWFNHMKEWADENDAIPAIVLHRPGTRIENSILVISTGDRPRLKEIYQLWREEHLQK